jgi:plasmid stabilization system protein ParE
MSLPVRFQLPAQAEADEALAWYQARQEGLGSRFITALEQIINSIGEQPDRYPEVEPRVREAIVSGWPYAVYYQIHYDCVMVISVFHTSRDPAVWQWRAE